MTISYEVMSKCETRSAKPPGWCRRGVSVRVVRVNYLRCLPAQLSRYELDQLKLDKPDSRLKEAEVEAKVFMTHTTYSRHWNPSRTFYGILFVFHSMPVGEPDRSL